MRAIAIVRPGFVPTSDAWEATDEADRTEHTGFSASDVGAICRQLDNSTRWRITAVQSGAATWEQVPDGPGSPSTLGTTNVEGNGSSYARNNHVHAHGVQTDPTLHASASALAAGFMTSADYLRCVGVGMANSVTVPAGSGTKAITTTSALLTAKNTSRTGRIVIVWWKSLDQAETRSGEIEFAVAWHDDDTQTIEQSNVSSNTNSGATPTITVAVHGVNVVLLLNADHTITVSLTRDATYARSCKVRYFIEEALGQGTVPATFQSATTNAAGTEIALTFDVALDEASVPAAGAFTLHGTTATIASVAISTVTVTLTLTGAVVYGETVTWDYAVPEENPLLADGDGGPVAAGSGLACTNAVPPLYVSSITNAAGSAITMTWEGALDEASTPGAGDFALAGTSATVDSVLVSGATVVLTLTTANVAYGESPTVSYTQGVTPLRSAAAVNVANVSTESVTNAVPPAYSSSTTNNAGDEIALTWAGNLNEANVPDPGDFTLAGTSATVLSVAVAAAVVTLTLTTALVEYGESATVSYTAGATPLQSAEGYQVADLTTEAVTNVTPPDFVSATTSADGSSIVVTFEGNLDATSEPAVGAFALSGTSSAIASVTSISGTDLTLALDVPVLYGETLLLSYTKPGTTPLRENTTEYECVSFVEQSVTNIAPPVLSGLTTNALGTEITMTYSAALDEASVPAAGDFAIGGDDATVNAVYVSGTTVRLTLDGAIEYGDSPTVSYTAGANPIQDAVSGYNVADLVTEACDNAVPPAYSAGATDVSGATITLTWAGNLNESSTPAASAFDLNGTSATVASVVVSGATSVLTLSGAVANGETVTCDYTVPGSNPLQSAEGYDLAPLTAAAVVNNVPA